MSSYDPVKYKEYYEKNKAKKLEQVLDYQTNRRDKVKRNAWERARNAEIRRQVIEHYGGKCVCCGEKEQAFLQLDHIDGNGNKHRREIEAKAGGRVSMVKWAWTNKYPDFLQLLCANCNMAKGIYGKCPHQKLSEPAEMTGRPEMDSNKNVGAYGRMAENYIIRGEYSSSLDA